jgi:alpha-L-fucosidase 2
MNPRSVLVAMMLGASALQAQSAQPTLLWYTHPATDWEEEALPIGNGRLGAMLFGTAP